MNPSPPKSYEELEAGYKKAKQTNVLLKKAVLQEQDHSRGLEKSVEDLEQRFKTQQRQLREAMETIDRLELSNQRLAKKLSDIAPASLSPQTSLMKSPSPSGAAAGSMAPLQAGQQPMEGGGSLTGQKYDMEEVMGEVIQAKMQENASLIDKMESEKELHEQAIKTMETKVNAVKISAEKKENELRDELSGLTEKFRAVEEEKERALEEVRSLKLEAKQNSESGMMREHELTAKLEAAERELKNWESKVTFNESKSAVLSKWNAHQRLRVAEAVQQQGGSEPAVLMAHAQMRSKAGEFMKMLNGVMEGEHMAEVGIGYAEGLKMKQEREEIMKRYLEAQEKVSKMEVEIAKLTAERQAFLETLHTPRKPSAVSPIPSEVLSSVTPLSPSRSDLSSDHEHSPSISSSTEGEELQSQQAQQAPAPITWFKVVNTPETTSALQMTTEETEREQRTKQYYESLVLYHSSKAQQADARAQGVIKELDTSREKEALLTKEAASSQTLVGKLSEELSIVRDDLASTRQNYEGQLAAMSEHVVNLNESVASLDSKLAGVKACKVLCRKCTGWNTIGWLLSDGQNGKLCSHGNHATQSFLVS